MKEKKWDYCKSKYLFAWILIGLFVAFPLAYCCHMQELAAGVLAASIAIGFGLNQSKIEGDRIFKELFQEFNKKYDCKFNNRLNDIVNLNIEFDKNGADYKLVIDYLNMCSEQYLWKTKRRIDNIVWESWENGMLKILNADAINKIVIAEIKPIMLENEKDSYYGFFQYLGCKLKDNPCK